MKFTLFNYLFKLAENKTKLTILISLLSIISVLLINIFLCYIHIVIIKYIFKQEQYIFLHKALLIGFQDMDTVLLKSDVTNKFNTLLNDKSPLKQTALYKEHQVSRF